MRLLVLLLLAACSSVPDEPQLMHAYWLETKHAKPCVAVDAGKR